MKKNSLILNILLSLCIPYMQAKCICINKYLTLFTGKDLQAYQNKYPSWKIVKCPTHQKFVNKIEETPAKLAYLCAGIGNVADLLDHHPDLTISPSSITIEVYTHSQNGITTKDISFIKNVEKRISLLKTANTIIQEKIDTKNESLDKTIDYLEKSGWTLNNNGTELILNIKSPEFTRISKALSKCILLPDFASECNKIELSYGSLSISLRNKLTKKVVVSTALYAKMCHTMLMANVPSLVIK